VLRDSLANDRTFSIREILLTGASFGLFLSLGDAWARFLRSLIHFFLPVNIADEELVLSSIEVICITLLSLVLIFIISKCQTAVQRVINLPPA